MSARAKWGHLPPEGQGDRLQMRRVALRLWVLCWLMLVWILLWGTVSAANVISGLAIALIITAAMIQTIVIRSPD